MKESMGEGKIGRRLAARIGAMPRGRFQRDFLLSENQCEKAKTFGQRHTEDGLNEDFAGSGGITTDRLSGFSTDDTDGDSAAEKTGSGSDVTRDFSKDHVDGVLIIFVRSLGRARLLDTCSQP
jgi:hypothetical protein